MSDVNQKLVRAEHLIAEMLPVVRYVSMGRKYVDVEPYPDASARRANFAATTYLEQGK